MEKGYATELRRGARVTSRLTRWASIPSDMDVPKLGAVGIADGPHSHPRWMESLRKWDPVTWVLFVHAIILLTLGKVANAPSGAVLAASLLVWRVGLEWWIRKSQEDRHHWLEFAKAAGSLTLAAAMMWADGGTESPFFFWYLILLGWQVLVQPVSHFIHLSGVGVAVYVGVVVVVPDLTAASIGRLMLLIAYCGILAVGRLRLEAEEATAQRAGRLLRDAFWVAPLALAVVEGEPSRVVYANRPASDLSRLLADDREADALTEVETLVRRARETGEAVGPLLVRLDSQNRYLRVLATSQGLGDDTSAVLCAEDVTDQVTAGEERQRFLQLASHQLRTPLTPIVGYAELLRDEDLDRSETRDAADTILREAKRLERLFERMATVVRLRHESHREIVETTVQAVLDELAETAPEVMVGVELRGNPWDRVKCHPESVAAALRELLDNSRRFGEPPIRLTWQTQGPLVELRITDAGRGPEAELDPDHLFGEWGKRSDVDRMPRGMGTRLGLLQARLLMGLTGGELKLIRREEGWAFTVELLAPTSGRIEQDNEAGSPEVHEQHRGSLVDTQSGGRSVGPDHGTT